MQKMYTIYSLRVVLSFMDNVFEIQRENSGFTVYIRTTGTKTRYAAVISSKSVIRK